MNVTQLQFMFGLISLYYLLKLCMHFLPGKGMGKKFRIQLNSIAKIFCSGEHFHARNLDFGLFMGWDMQNHTWTVSAYLHIYYQSTHVYIKPFQPPTRTPLKFYRPRLVGVINQFNVFWGLGC